MEKRNIKNELHKADLDVHAGIKLIKLTGDENISVFAAEISPNTELNPHFHLKGIEIYQIYKGKGLMKIGNRINNSVEWVETAEVNEGDCFSIGEGVVHQIINDSENSLQAIFSCRESHIGKDRFFVLMS
jgi:mannose-6-phosphate isomerase-like protein (cupin superfamily)